MSDIAFVTVHPNRGTVAVTGPITGIRYSVSAGPTPIAAADLSGILEILGDPCCGQSLPFDGKVKIFGKANPSAAQMGSVPDTLLRDIERWKAKAQAAAEARARAEERKSKKVED